MVALHTVSTLICMYISYIIHTNNITAISNNWIYSTDQWMTFDFTYWFAKTSFTWNWHLVIDEFGN